METANLTPKGVTLTAEDIREGMVGVLSIYMQEPQFQGQTKERLGSPEAQAQVDSVVRPALETFPAREPDRGRGHRRADRAGRQGARGVARGVAGGVAQDGGLAPAEPARQAGRLLVDRSGRERAVHRRGRLRRRLGQAGARAQDAGDPAAARQGAEHRAGVAAEGALEQGASGRRLGAGLRRRRGLQDRAPALPQDHPADGRRLRRPPHRDAAADVLLPAPAPADRTGATSTWRSRRCSASTTARRRTGRWTRPIAIASSPGCPRTRVPRSCASRAWARCSRKS